MGLRRGSLVKQVGSTGLDAYGGHIMEDFLTEWRGQQKVKRVEEMLFNSPVIGGLRLSIEMPIREIEWFFTGPEGVDEENDPGLAILNDSLDALSHSWNDHVIDALTFVFYGWSMFSITYQRDGARWLWRKFKPLGQDTVYKWLMDDDGDLMGLQQYPHQWPDPIPIERMLLYRFRKTKNNPEGESVLRNAWVPYYYTKNLQEIEAIGIERNLAGLPVIQPPMGADMADGSTDYNAAHKLLRNARNDEQAGILLPPPMGEGDHMRWIFNLVTSPGGTKTIDSNLVVSRYEKRTLMAALSQFLMLGMDNVGALATFEGATDFHAMMLNSISDIISETFSKYAIPRLLQLNGIDPDGYQLQHSPAGDIDNIAFADILAKAGTFLTWTPEDEADLRARLRMPEIEPEELQRMHEEKEAQNQLLMQGLQQANQQQNNEPDIDENRAVYGWEAYAANNAPDDDERRRQEGRFTRVLRNFFNDQQDRVVEGVKDKNIGSRPA